MSTPTQVPVNTGGVSVSGSITFSLGTSLNDPNAIVFGEANTPTSVSALEIPKMLASLGGVQNHVVHEFPGGYKTVQAFGAFPHTLTWDGILLGGNAFARSFQLDTMRRTGTTAYLIYGPWRWEGLLTEYLADARHQNYVGYRCSFEPAVDLTAASQSAPPTLSTVQNNLTQLLNGINQLYSSQTPVLSAGSQSALSAFVSAITPIVQALTGSGILTASQRLTVTEATAAANGALAIDAASANGQVSAVAAGALASVAAVSSGLTSPATQTTVTVINPNLVALAAQYLGDASRWSDIATANALLDVQPTGLFTLQIPIT
jgi:hypothetical protein